ncbi:MAG TPA: D-glycero-beta-D-manno-heptose 1-phosphate adenylyltransferase [Candidatus Aquicultoraceae bacterium]|nr:D-glycero-beta-D-manno-heptose 1-phosphate adenylyltransferase [Candidatus Aquicultoraceae bacterium]
MISRKAVSRTVARLRRQGMRIVFTNGCFDILHAGHAMYLRKAASLGDVLVVGVNSDASVRRLKGEGRPLQGAADRAYLLASLSCVSLVVVFPQDTPETLIEEVAPDVLVKGGDWKGREIVGAGFVRSRGGTVRTIRFLPGRSTTAILRRAGSVQGRRRITPGGGPSTAGARGPSTRGRKRPVSGGRKRSSRARRERIRSPVSC